LTGELEEDKGASGKDREPRAGKEKESGVAYAKSITAEWRRKIAQKATASRWKRDE